MIELTSIGPSTHESPPPLSLQHLIISFFDTKLWFGLGNICKFLRTSSTYTYLKGKEYKYFCLRL